MDQQLSQLTLLERTLNKISGSSIQEAIQILPLESFSSDVYKVNFQNKSYLLKIFRQFLLEFSNKQVQNHVIMKLSDLGKYPKVFKASQDLRFQGFINGGNPDRNNASKQQMLRIFDWLIDLVKIFGDDEMINGKELRERRRISRMFDIFQAYSQQCMQKHPHSYQICKQYVNAILHPSVRSHLESIASQNLVPTHGDCHFHNVLVTPQNELYVIDYEYFGLNYRGFDLGNFFNAYAIDYKSFQIREDLELPESTKNELIQRYYGQVAPNLSMEQCVKQVEVGRLLSHLFWFWSGVKAVQEPKITIDIQSYIKQRYQAFDKIYKRL